MKYTQFYAVINVTHSTLMSTFFIYFSFDPCKAISVSEITA